MNTERRFEEASRAYDAGNYVGALTLLSELLDSTPQACTFMLLGETMAKLGLFSDAAQMLARAGDMDDELALTCLRRAAFLHYQAGEDEAAQLAGLKLFSRAPDDAANAYTLIRVFQRIGETQLIDALKNRLVTSDDIEHLQLAAELIGDDTRNENNLTLFSNLRRLTPDDPFTRATLTGFAREFCDFERLAAEEQALESEFAAGDFRALAAEAPHQNIMWCDDEARNRVAVNASAVSPIVPETQARRRSQPHAWGKRIRIGYLSNDFWDDHATMRLLQSVLTAHDTSRFEITLFCYTPERFVGGHRERWGRIVSILGMSDAEAEAEIRRHRIDILVDLKGHTGGSRSAIMNRMAAPVQVAWLGFPGSAVHIDCDYVIGDPVVLPGESKPQYHEKFCRLPETYQPNDPVHRPLPPALSRREAGLPQEGVILAAFHSPRKVSRRTMTLWARILNRIDNARLWMMCDSKLAQENIRRFLGSHGIAPDRVIFAPKTAYERHVARLPAADLGLDTFPCNGHTTTSDLLWSGLPVPTMRGRNFASRVSESLLNAIGLADLVAEDEDDYVDLVVSLATEPARLEEVRQRLADNRYRAPLFDAERFCRHLEGAFETMAARARIGAAPDHFDVPALPPRTGSFQP